MLKRDYGIIMKSGEKLQSTRHCLGFKEKTTDYSSFVIEYCSELCLRIAIALHEHGREIS